MDKSDDWFPCFSMLFWCCTKLAGLLLSLFGLYSVTWLVVGIGGEGSLFWRLVLTAVLPIVLGFAMLKSDLVHQIATEEVRRSRSKRA